MFPSVNLMDSRYSRDLLSYRFNGIQAAMDNANNTGYDGARQVNDAPISTFYTQLYGTFRFPWESGYTGREVTPDCCPEVVEYQLHITADISYAMRLYFAVTHDYDYMEREGCQLSRQIAKFWASRATFNETTRHYELNGKQHMMRSFRKTLLHFLCVIRQLDRACAYFQRAQTLRVATNINNRRKNYCWL